MNRHENLIHTLLQYGDFRKIEMSNIKDAFKQPSKTLEDYEFILDNSANKNQILWFYADWCGHCHKMKDAWEQASHIGNMYADWHVVDVSNEGKAFAQKLNIRSFPTVLKFENKYIHKHNGERTVDNFIHFARSADSTT